MYLETKKWRSQNLILDLTSNFSCSNNDNKNVESSNCNNNKDNGNSNDNKYFSERILKKQVAASSQYVFLSGCVAPRERERERENVLLREREGGDLSPHAWAAFSFLPRFISFFFLVT